MTGGDSRCKGLWPLGGALLSILLLIHVQGYLTVDAVALETPRHTSSSSEESSDYGDKVHPKEPIPEPQSRAESSKEPEARKAPVQHVSLADMILKLPPLDKEKVCNALCSTGDGGNYCNCDQPVLP